MITYNTGMEIYESTMKQLTMYRDIEISEKQIEAGQVKDARTALRETRGEVWIIRLIQIPMYMH